ncbi:hypothetical protein QTH87_08980 [Variovorax sp. J22P168]|uniref:hypothetical protein n=1 Tax=Variovorax jilinensis TaxID=3053513 RepID=UPI002577F7C9|nr:hypothetical protein [Variovorax sp. J22P168]MDM0012566.1 hypothetical protein [Variovorax sp. J22P168]
MNKDILFIPVGGTRFECRGPQASIVWTRSRSEALFWQLLGYTVHEVASGLPAA